MVLCKSGLFAVVSMLSCAHIVCAAEVVRSPVPSDSKRPVTLELSVTTNSEDAATKFFRAARAPQFDVVLMVSTTAGASSNWTVKVSRRSFVQSEASSRKQMEALVQSVPVESTQTSCSITLSS